MTTNVFARQRHQLPATSTRLLQTKQRESSTTSMVNTSSTSVLNCKIFSWFKIISFHLPTMAAISLKLISHEKVDLPLKMIWGPVQQRGRELRWTNLNLKDQFFHKSYKKNRTDAKLLLKTRARCILYIISIQGVSDHCEDSNHNLLVHLVAKYHHWGEIKRAISLVNIFHLGIASEDHNHHGDLWGSHTGTTCSGDNTNNSCYKGPQ